MEIGEGERRKRVRGVSTTEDVLRNYISGFVSLLQWLVCLFWLYFCFTPSGFFECGLIDFIWFLGGEGRRDGSLEQTLRKMQKQKQGTRTGSPHTFRPLQVRTFQNIICWLFILYSAQSSQALHAIARPFHLRVKSLSYLTSPISTRPQANSSSKPFTNIASP